MPRTVTMPTRENTFAADAGAVLVPADHKASSVPIWIARDAGWAREAPLTDAQRAWVEAAGFKGSGNKHLLIPASDGSLAGVAFGIGEARDPMTRPELMLGLLAGALPPGLYHLASSVEDAALAGVAWGLGAYRFRRYKAGNGDSAPQPAQLKLPSVASLERVLATVEAVWLGRDLINTPAGDFGPQELENAARALAERHGARIASIVGDELVARNFPMIHAVGRASTRPPRLIDLSWGRADAPRVTLVGKGICFDTGGLDIKPASAMLLMKAPAPPR
jgi:leucyl aminopeptidase